MIRRWPAGTDALRAGGTLRRLAHTVRARRTLLLAGARAAAAQDSLLELPGQRGGHKAVLLSGQWQRRRVSARRGAVPVAQCQGSPADWYLSSSRIVLLP